MIFFYIINGGRKENSDGQKDFRVNFREHSEIPTTAFNLKLSLYTSLTRAEEERRLGGINN